MSIFLNGEAYEQDMAETVVETQVERYTGNWEMKDGSQPVGMVTGMRRKDSLSRLRLTDSQAKFFLSDTHWDIYWEVFTD